MSYTIFLHMFNIPLILFPVMEEMEQGEKWYVMCYTVVQAKWLIM